MEQPQSNPLHQLFDYDDAIAPFVVIIRRDTDDEPEEEGPLHVGIRVRRWGSYFFIEPKICWMERTGRSFDCGEMNSGDLQTVESTAAMAVADVLAKELPVKSSFYPN